MPPLMLHFKGNVVITNRYSIQSNVKPHSIIEISELFQKIVERESPVPLNQFSVKTRNVKTLIRQAAVKGLNPIGMHILFAPVKYQFIKAFFIVIVYSFCQIAKTGENRFS